MRQPLGGSVAACALYLATLAGCNSKDASATPPAAAAPPAAEPGAAEPEPEKRAMRCDQFFTKDDVEKLGFDASRYDGEGMLSYGDKTLTCHIDPTTFQVFTDRRFKDGIRKVFETPQENGQSAADLGIKFVDGPKYGSDTLWMEMGGSAEVHFVSSDGQMTATVVSTDRAACEKVAKALSDVFER